MKKAKIAELKNNLSRYLDHVRGGGSVLVLDRDEPVAQIVPLQETGRGSRGREARLLRLERRELIRRGSGGLPDWLGKRKPPRLRGSVLGDLLREREGGW
jgi:prevent-host-death family protein